MNELDRLLEVYETFLLAENYEGSYKYFDEILSYGNDDSDVNEELWRITHEGIIQLGLVAENNEKKKKILIEWIDHILEEAQQNTFRSLEALKTLLSLADNGSIASSWALSSIVDYCCPDYEHAIPFVGGLSESLEFYHTQYDRTKVLSFASRNGLLCLARLLSDGRFFFRKPELSLALCDVVLRSNPEDDEICAKMVDNNINAAGQIALITSSKLFYWQESYCSSLVNLLEGGYKEFVNPEW